MEAVNSEGASFFPGASGEQILLSGVDWSLMKTGIRVLIGKEVLRVRSKHPDLGFQSVRLQFNSGLVSCHPKWCVLIPESRVLL